MPYRENLGTGKVTANLNAAQYLSVRYGRNNNSQPYGAAVNSTERQLGRQHQQAQLVQRQPQLGARRVEAERVHLPGAPTSATTSRRASSAPNETFPNGVTIGANGNTPQTTRAEEVSVPRRLLVAHDRHGRPRPRLQGRRQLHQRAAPLHHVQHRQGRDLQHPPHQRSERADFDRDGERRRLVGEHPDQAVRHLLPGRLARRAIA